MSMETETVIERLERLLANRPPKMDVWTDDEAVWEAWGAWREAIDAASPALLAVAKAAQALEGYVDFTGEDDQAWNGDPDDVRFRNLHSHLITALAPLLEPTP